MLVCGIALCKLSVKIFCMWLEIKKIVKRLGQAVLLGEDGSHLVVLPLDKYLSLVDNTQGESPSGSAFEGNGSENGQELLLIEKLNRDIALLKEEIRKKELEELNTEETLENGHIID